MDQTARIQRITHMIENGRMHAQLRHGMLGKPEFGILVKDGISVWGTMPDDESGDQEFVNDLLAKAKRESSRT